MKESWLLRNCLMDLFSEYGYIANITEKSDVYSFGVVLLEILSGCSAIEPQVGDGMHIVDWVKKNMGSFEPTFTILDSKLQGYQIKWCKKCFRHWGLQCSV